MIQMNPKKIATPSLISRSDQSDSGSLSVVDEPRIKNSSQDSNVRGPVNTNFKPLRENLSLLPNDLLGKTHKLSLPVSTGVLNFLRSDEAIVLLRVNKYFNEHPNLAVLKKSSKFFSDAILAAKNITVPSRRAATLCKVAGHLFQANFIHTSYRYFNKAKHIADFGIFIESQPNLLKMIAIGQAVANNFVDAINTAHSIIKHDVMVNTLAAIAAEYVKKGDLNAAMNLANTISNPRDRSEILRMIVIIQAEFGDYDNAKNTANSISETYSKSAAITAIAMKQISARAFNEAKDTANDIAVPVDKDAVFEAIVAAQLNLDDFNAAKLTTNLMSIYKDKCLSEIATAQVVRSGEFDEAIITAKAITDPFIRSETLESIAVERANTASSLVLIRR